MDLLRGVLGIGLFVAFCWWISIDRKRIDWKLVGGGILLQLVLAFVVLRVPGFPFVLEKLTWFFIHLLQFSDAGAELVFGSLTNREEFGFIIATHVLPSVVFFSALTSLLYYLGILQWVVYGIAWVMSRTMRLSGAESLAAAANIFVGQTEAPLVVKPYIPRMTASEILCLMTGGFTTIAGAVFVAYISMLGGGDETQQVLFGKHLMTASILSAPAAIVCAKLIYPEVGEIDTDLKICSQSVGENIFDSVIHGTTQGVKLAVNIGAALIVFTALVALLNYISVELLGSWTGLNAWIARVTGGAYTGLTVQFVFGVFFAGIAWLLGGDTGSLLFMGQLFGEKLVLNEFIAYSNLANMLKDGDLTDERSILVTTYALCGFANFTSVGIQVGGIAVLAPNQRSNLVRLATRALIGGTVACFMTAAVAGLFF